MRRDVAISVAAGVLLYLLVSLLAPRCAHAEEWKPPTRAETAIFVAAELLVAVDLVQTRDFLHGRANGYEINPLLGAHPSDARLLATGGAAMLALAAGWYFLPSPWRDCVTLPVLFVEVPVVTRNFVVGARLRW